ncbi:MAG TPA: PQQ-dependent sugar dehydrogenase, partial [Candidatus Deferrimicrobiaceae bacterium]|nr:PQQ-dependent sugar dehydrogenase [Candidatus Deferrimicrobiaceae bacterium]
ENYGWNVMEGAHCYGSASCDNAGLVLPVTEYDHGLGCSVSGGMVYRGTEFPSFQGTYVYGDFCTGRIWGLRKAGTAWENTLLADTTHQISTFGEDEAGNLYVAAHGTGAVYRIAPM